MQGCYSYSLFLICLKTQLCRSAIKYLEMCSDFTALPTYIHTVHKEHCRISQGIKSLIKLILSCSMTSCDIT